MDLLRHNSLTSLVNSRHDAVKFSVAAQFGSFMVGHFLHLYALALLLVTFFAGVTWIAATRRSRMIQATPTSRVASAAQGYVELIGKGECIQAPVLSPITQQPCLWYRYRIQQKKWYEKNWRTIEEGSSEAPFSVRDHTGVCEVDPRRAVVHSCHKKTWRKGSYLYDEEMLLADEEIYALGEFRSENPAAVQLDVKQALNTVLADWKRDQATLKARFDTNGDGQVDQDEWRLARLAALQQIHADHAKERALPATHHLRAPGDHRTYLLSNLSQAALSARTGRGAFFYMLWFGVMCVVTLAYFTHTISYPH